MTAENRILALEYALKPVAPQSGGITAGQATVVAAVAGIYYRWLEGPAVLLVTVSTLTFDQAAPDGPGTPTIWKENTVQITDLQQYPVTVGEVDSRNQPVTTDALAWSIDNPAVASVTPSADGYSAVIAGLTDGTATYTVTDSTANPPLVGTGSVTVVSSTATSLVLTEGTPEDQPPAAA